MLPHTVACETWPDVERRIEAADKAVLFVDPKAVDDSVDLLVRLRARFSSVAVVICAVLDGESVRQIARLAYAGFAEMVLFGFDDTRERLRALVDDAVPAPMSSLGIMEPALQRLPKALKRAVLLMFTEPHRFRSTEDVALVARLSVRATFRHLRNAGFPSPRKLIASARVLRAYHLLARSTRPATFVASRLGYP